MASQTPCLLIAERNPNVREMLRREFRMQGFEVRMAADAFGVWDCLRADRPYIAMVLDADIPNTSPLTIMEMVRQKRPGLPVILHVYQAEDDAGAAAPGAGARVLAVVERSGDLSRLMAAVRQVVDSPENARF